MAQKGELMKEKWFTSIGLDLGTSTTKFIVSRLFIEERNDGFSLPSCQITKREIAYTSQVYATPLLNDTEIDMSPLARILEKEYGKAGIRLSDVKAGAVIITGETARKNNAKQMIHYLADRSGDFVVATAGADLEGILAGKGSGAQKRSEKTGRTVANVDIGGGTANIALFKNGKAIQTVTFHVGGRLIRLSRDGEIKYISEHMKRWLSEKKYEIKTNERISFKRLSEICSEMIESMLSFLINGKDEFGAMLLVKQPQMPILPIDEIVFSGGIGAMIDQPSPVTIKEVTKYGDMGPLLAAKIPAAARKLSIQTTAAIETTRATVIGAGMQNTEISGATVHVNRSLLPIRNVPIHELEVLQREKWDPAAFESNLHALLMRVTQLYEEDCPQFALALSKLSYCSYSMLQEIAAAIHEQYMTHFFRLAHVIVICENDMAKALGQALRLRFSNQTHVICIDQIDFTHGDYIDLGLPVGEEAISVSIKTLAFSS